ncbi:site-specific integrase [Shewanella xiamenensis]|uniref:tyrosine-type recombinase/integrase n=1 Tax=Shewanella xiamenensis TaxID=332186 RepID=UPI00217F0DAE|nr:site-specific integrase [Shewanella xiamenensis]MCT8858414.1 site-specific integrase [Shewanella xiamenensis]UWG65398.1 site-specific integrase [Shewanella xiamenensis]
MYLIQSSDVYKQTESSVIDSSYQFSPVAGNIGSLPTLFNQDGSFNHEANSYLFYQKAIKAAKDLSPCSQALMAYYQFLEDNNLRWDHFLPVKRLKPTYLFRSHLLKQIKNGDLAYSTASVRMNQIVNYYKWLMHDDYLKIKNEKEAPFKVEFVSIQSTGMLAHISPTFSIQTSDLRIKVPRDSSSKNIRPLTPLSNDSLDILTSYLPQASIELRLQVLLSIDTGMRINEIATLTLDALKTAIRLAESEHRYELIISPQLNGVQTKYAKRRTIEISAELLTQLDYYRTSERRLQRVKKLNNKLDNLFELALGLKQEAVDALERCERHEPLFVSEQGNPVTAKSIEARWSELRSVIKKSHPTFIHRFHDFRSTYGTYRLSDLLEAGLLDLECMELLMAWMGHKNESTTWKYLRFLRRKKAFKVKFGILDNIMHSALHDEHGRENE